MRYARFEHNGKVSYGIMQGDTVREIVGTPFEGKGESGTTLEARAVRLLAPCEPSTVYALAHNYPDHLGGKPRATEPQIFLKVPGSVIGPGEAIVLPRGAGKVDAEGELVVVIGKRCRNVSATEAMRYVFGYTCGNDVSARVWQKHDLNWWRAKSSDTFTPIGPCIETELDPSKARIACRINGKPAQRCIPSDLIFGIPSLIAWISGSVTLAPGDLIFTGTSGEPAEMHGGDEVEVDIEGIGVLANTVKEG